MKTGSALALALALGAFPPFAAAPARAQFANSAGLAPASPNAPNISGAGTGLSAPASITPPPAIGAPGPNAIAAPPASPIQPIQPIQPGFGPAGMPPGTMIPPAAIARERARQSRPR
ncbi:hypothetical protein NFI95_07980 [Acetobacteraceae bacterium KSS8]|uniref:Uncharacterized protein n=1 Tax=Endosaccharibacter trunci TaxID=2812733 RepID=A0ABT1W685_9PROT|nr:hypothetical protein [Acetobacteraceae bacterium KSS8]